MTAAADLGRLALVLRMSGSDASPEHVDRPFTWRWWRRRVWIRGLLAVCLGTGFAVWHSASMNAWSECIDLGWHAILAMAVAMAAGPVLATLSRELKLPSNLERIAVVASIIVGLAVAIAALTWLNAYHDVLMGRSRHATAMDPVGSIREFNRLISRGLGNAPILILMFLACGGWSLPWYWMERKRIAQDLRKKELHELRADKNAADMRLTLLQAQIEPHFLFNTLASVRALIATEPRRAAATLDAFSDYLRSTLPRLRGDGGTETNTLGAQLEICRQYLAVMQIRMGQRLSISVAATADVLGHPFPALVLLPLVENAVKHGIEPKAGPGSIALEAQIVLHAGTQFLEVAVQDDGAGLRTAGGTGLGVTNVRTQLRALFGNAATLRIEQVPWGGVRASIRIPATT